MVKLFLLIIIAALVFVGLNWEQISGQVDDGMNTVEEVKEKTRVIKDQAENKLDETQDKVGQAKENVNDLIDKLK